MHKGTNSLKGVFSLLFLAVFNILSFASQYNSNIHEQLRFSYITIDDGLNGNRVRALGQDSLGFIWIGTGDGLARYDGYDLVQYRTYRDDTLSVEMKEIREIYTDSEGTLWAVGIRGIAYYDILNDEFLKFHHPDLTADISGCRGIDQDKDGNIWFGTSIGLLKYNPKSNELELLEQSEDDSSPPTGTLDKLIVSEHGDIWICTLRNGVSKYNIETNQFKHYKAQSGDEGLAEDRIERIYEDTKGNIWIGYNNNGVSMYSYKTHKFKHYYPEQGVKEAGRVRGIIEDKQGSFWFGTQAGLYLFDRNSETFSLYAHAAHPVSTLSHNSIQTMMVDNQEGIWIGTYAGGVNYANTVSTGIIHFEYSHIPNQYYLNDKNVYSLAFDNNNNIWVGTENGGLNYLERNTGKFTYFTETDDEYGTYSNNIKSIYVDPTGIVWLGTYRGGMSQYNPETGLFRHYLQTEENPQGLSDETVYIVYPDPTENNILWIATVDRMVRFNTETELFIEDFYDYTNAPEIARISDVCSTSNGMLVLGGANQLVVVNTIDKSMEEFIEIAGINIRNVDFVFQDSNGFIWFGHNDTHLMRYSISTKTGIDIDLSDKINGSLIEGVNDHLGNIWLSSTQGVWKLEKIIENPDSFNVAHFDKSDNIQSLEFLYHSQAKANSGEILFGGINGFNLIYPDKVTPNPYVPNVLLTGFYANGKEMHVGDKIGKYVILKKDINTVEKIKLRHKVNLFSIHFSGSHYLSPENNQFKYQLKGFDEDWRYTNSNIRQIQYANLKRGKYTLLIDASNNNGVFSGNPHKIQIIIVPPFYKRIVFFVFLAILLGIGIYFFMKWRESQLKRDKEHLEKEMLKGKEEIENAKQQLNQQREEMLKRDEAEKNIRYVSNGIAKFSEILSQKFETIDELSNSIITELVDYVDANQGILYRINDDNPSDQYLELSGSFAASEEVLNNTQYKLGEGYIGTCFVDKEMLIIDNLTDDYGYIESGLGKQKLNYLYFIPIRQSDLIVGVIELGTFEKIETYKLDFVEKLTENITSVIAIFMSNIKNQEMLERSNNQSRELQEHQEEMRQNFEELQAIQEDMQRNKENWDKERSALKEHLETLEKENEALKANIDDTKIDGKVDED